MDDGDALILMARAPLPGRVKSRLVPRLGRRGAVALYRCLLEDAAGEMSRVAGVERYLFYTPASARSLFARRPFSAFRRLPQGGGDLGSRMARALAFAFARGARAAAVVGADCPALSAGRVRAALAELGYGAAAAFGPADDGGFYLAAFAAPPGDLFRGVAWGTGSVLASVTAACRAAGMPYALLPPESDLDTPGDVAAFARWARGHASPRCPRTRGWVSASAARRGSAAARPQGRRSRS